MPASGPLHAWIDESMRTVGLPNPSYLLGGVITDPAACGPYREALTALLTSGRKLHWRELDRRHRERAIAAVSRFLASHLVVVAAPMDASRQERARAICLERLCWELDRRGVTSVHLEARPQNLMRRDVRTVDRVRGRGDIADELRVDHRQPSEDPMLWAADLVLGATGELLAGRGGLIEPIRDTVTVVQVDL